MSFLCHVLSSSCRCVVTVVVSCREIVFLLAVSDFTTALVILVSSFLTAVIICAVELTTFSVGSLVLM